MHRILCLVLFAGLIACSRGPIIARQAPVLPPYPETKRETLVETLHGVEVADPYRWLESTEEPAALAWTEAQNAFTMKYIEALPQYAALKKRLTEIWDFDKMQPPVPRKGKLFLRKTTGLQNQPVLYLRENGADTALIDPNTLSTDGTTAMDWWYVSPTGKYIAYGLSEKGSEQSVLHLYDVAAKKEVDTPITGCRYAAVSFLPDETGFFYSRKLDGDRPGEIDTDQSVRFHRIGDDPEKDEVIAKATLKEGIIVSGLDETGRWLLISEYQGSSGKARLVLYDAKGRTSRPLVDNFDNIWEGDIFRGKIYLRTDRDGALNWKILRVDAETLAWEEFIPAHEKDILDAFLVTGDHIAVHYLHDVASQVALFDLTGKRVATPALPTIGSVHGMAGSPDEKELFLSFSSYGYPPAILRWTAAEGLTEFFRAAVPVDPSAIETTQVFYPAADGMKIPMFLVHKKGLEKNGMNPTALVGYGGFNVSYPLHFSPANWGWLEQGGIYAVANIRGGGEYGEAWHRAGMLDKKETCFNDLADAMRWLITEKYASPATIGIMGGSNGGLLTGALVTREPHLFSAALVAVPLLDMLRFHKFLIGRYWVSEYGSADDPEQFQWLYRYSPYHKVKQGERYPAVLLTAGEHDSRVHPLHAKKMAAALQWANTSKEPILLYVDTKAGHGQGKGTEMRIAEAAMEWAFFMDRLGLAMPASSPGPSPASAP